MELKEALEVIKTLEADLKLEKLDRDWWKRNTEQTDKKFDKLLVDFLALEQRLDPTETPITASGV